MPKKEVAKGVIHLTDNSGNLLSIVVRTSYKEEGVNFFTNQNSPFQLGFIKQPKGYASKPHTHTPLGEDNVITTVQEVVFVVEGEFCIDLYGNNQEVIESVILKPKDSCLFISGGHGYRVIKSCKVVTVKQGPYPGAQTAKIYIK